MSYQQQQAERAAEEAAREAERAMREMERAAEEAARALQQKLQRELSELSDLIRGPLGKSADSFNAKMDELDKKAGELAKEITRLESKE